MNMHGNRNQQGMALVVSLIILVSLTMLGLTAIQRTTTDVSMAGNQREAGLMFQSAEVGLSSAEFFVNVTAISKDADFDDTNGKYNLKTKASDPTYLSLDYFSPVAWSVGSTEAGTDMVGELGIAEEPRYMLEYLGDRSNNDLALVNVGGGYGSVPTGIISSIYRATARGTGLTGNSYRYVQSYFGVDFTSK